MVIIYISTESISFEFKNVLPRLSLFCVVLTIMLYKYSSTHLSLCVDTYGISCILVNVLRDAVLNPVNIYNGGKGFRDSNYCMHPACLLDSGVGVISGCDVLSSPRDGGMLGPWVHFHLTSLIGQLLSIKIHTHIPTSLSLMAPLL